MSIFTKNRFALLLISVLVASCTIVNNGPVHIEGEKISFGAIPKEIVFGNTFTIILPESRPSGMSIRDPIGVWYIIHDPNEGIFHLKESEYSTSGSLEISTTLIKGVIWKDGKKTDARVFTVPGEYIIYFADNLETEPENTFSLMTSVILKAPGKVSPNKTN